MLTNSYYYSSGWVSRHLKIKEIECKCGCGFGTKKGDFDVIIADCFEEIRLKVHEKVGIETAIHVNSGCRCDSHNENIGGVPNSRHKLGHALDLRCPKGIDYMDFHKICSDVIGKFGGVGCYPAKNFVHIDFGRTAKRWHG